MNEKDEQLNGLFDEYANDLQPRTDLAQKARDELVRKNEKKQKPALRYGVIFGSLAAAAAVAVFAFSVLPGLFTGNNDGATNEENGPSDASPATPSAVSYTIGEVRATKTTRSDISDFIDISRIENAGYEVYSENYYNCYIKESNTLAYVKAVFGVSTDKGNIEISVIAERDGYKRTDLAEQYGYLMKSDRRISYAESYQDGEYMTMAYITDYDIHYYVSTMGNTDGAQNLFNYFL
ncbi:MAG: hypothetical protein HDT28_02805 [Clostridiales bacterium]|nr:hypothetical protein [Clostridiales bacterium]